MVHSRLSFPFKIFFSKFYELKKKTHKFKQKCKISLFLFSRNNNKYKKLNGKLKKQINKTIRCLEKILKLFEKTIVVCVEDILF